MTLTPHSWTAVAAAFGAYLLAGLLLQPLPRTCEFGGDVWEYQSMAVNFARGHGLVAGLREPLADYRFDAPEAAPELLAHFEQVGEETSGYHVYRTPGFPLMAGLIYKLVGIHPWAVYFLNRVLLALVAAWLPRLGESMRPGSGRWAGLAAGLAFFATSYRLAGEFMTEPLILATLLGVALLTVRVRRHPTVAGCVILGVASALACLVKGSLMFLPPLLGMWFAWDWLRGRLPFRILPPLALSMLIPLAGWSSYVSSIHGSFVLLTTQGDKVLLEGNNELSLLDGGWHPEYQLDVSYWRKPAPGAEAFLYNQPEARDRSAWANLAAFYRVYWKDAPRLFMHKINRAFERFPPLRWLCWILIWERVSWLFRLWDRPRGLHLAALLAGAAIYLASHQLYVIFKEIVVWLALAMGCQVWAAWRPGPRPFRIPGELSLLMINFCLVTLLTFGRRRFVQPLDPFILLALGLAVAWTWRQIRGRHVPSGKEA